MNRLERGERRHPAGAADIDEDVVELGVDLFRWVLPGDRPPWRLCGRAESALQREVVDLDDDTVDVVLDVVAGLAPLGGGAADAGEGVQHPVAGRGRQPRGAPQP